MDPIYHPIEAPEYLGLDVAQPCEERWRMMRDALDGVEPGRLLDIGCHTGWFCRRFARHGWEVTGIDRSLDWLEHAASIGTPGGAIPISFRHGDILDCELPDADVALVLSVLMYVGSTHFIDVMRKVSEKAPIAFVDYGGIYAGWMPSPTEFAERIISGATEYRHYKLLGRSLQDSRRMIVFEREHTLRRIWWVVGATGVGKRHFIKRATEAVGADGYRGLPGNAASVWPEDGVEMTWREVSDACPTGTSFVRWQYGRDSVLREWAKRPLRVENRIALLECEPNEHARRVRERGGTGNRDPFACAREQGALSQYVASFSDETGIPVDRFDVTED